MLDEPNHDNLEPFHQTNIKLLNQYEMIMSGDDTAQKDLIHGKLQLLCKIKDDPGMNPHEDTIFHCSGPPFDHRY